MEYSHSKEQYHFGGGNIYLGTLSLNFAGYVKARLVDTRAAFQPEPAIEHLALRHISFYFSLGRSCSSLDPDQRDPRPSRNAQAWVSVGLCGSISKNAWDVLLSDYVLNHLRPRNLCPLPCCSLQPCPALARQTLPKYASIRTARHGDERTKRTEALTSILLACAGRSTLVCFVLPPCLLVCAVQVSRPLRRCNPRIGPGSDVFISVRARRVPPAAADYLEYA
ncbi:hypothetical protein BC628DRAFT_511007 [Trametes gibbosa]|nr:hypothetical protein BC628DRAFT_511007 [Trametes gibbosa]